MTPKVLKQVHAEYTPARYNGLNTSGWSPIGDYILVKPDTVANSTSGGVELPDDIVERMELAAMTGIIVECGDEAFKWNADRTRHFEGKKPKAGDRVIFEKYAGKPILGEDSEHYRIMDDKAVGGIRKGAA